MIEMIEIIEFREEYKEQIIELWLDICIVEHGFYNWEKNIKNMDNDTFIHNKRKLLGCYRR